jgi:methanogenic corrinoid protein MtbC1
LRTLDKAGRLYRQALERGDEARCLQVVLDMRLAGQDMAVIGDQIVAAAFHELGERWDHGEATVYQERRGVEITRHVLTRLEETLAPPDPAAPTAIGATLSGDAYSLPGLLGELVLLELGWQAQFLGSDLPVETVAQGVEDLRPRALWLSVSHLKEPERFVRDYHHLYDTCLARQCAVVIGGRALTRSVRQELQYASYGDNLQHLRSFALSLYKPT